VSRATHQRSSAHVKPANSDFNSIVFIRIIVEFCLLFFWRAAGSEEEPRDEGAFRSEAGAGIESKTIAMAKIEPSEKDF
jgi:hypothetical protein